MVKSQVTIFLDTQIKKELDKRAKKELMSTEELVYDIIRRSVVSYKGNNNETDNVDDKFLTFFSRKRKSKK
jgi:metal-responsive CopG/Arc/MetJ family transcriptional regulator